MILLQFMQTPVKAVARAGVARRHHVGPAAVCLCRHANDRCSAGFCHNSWSRHGTNNARRRRAASECYCRPHDDSVYDSFKCARHTSQSIILTYTTPRWTRVLCRHQRHRCCAIGQKIIHDSCPAQRHRHPRLWQPAQPDPHHQRQQPRLWARPHHPRHPISPHSPSPRSCPVRPIGPPHLSRGHCRPWGTGLPHVNSACNRIITHFH